MELRDLRELIKRMSGDEADVELIRLTTMGFSDSAISGLLKQARYDEQGWCLNAPVSDAKCVWNVVLAVEYPHLAAIASRLLSLHPTSTNVERL